MLERFTVMAEGLDHPECAAWGPDGRIYAGGEAGQIYKVSLGGTIDQVAETGGFLLGLALDADGRIYACDLARAEVVRADPRSGAVEVYSTGTDDEKLRTPNYPVFDDKGNLYVTDSGVWKANDGLVFRVAPEGDTVVWARTCTRFPNGCCLAPDGDALFVVESLLPGVSRIAIEADGSAGATDLFVELPGSVPDGIAFDSEGALYVACYRPDRIYCVAPSGKAKILAEDPEGTLLAAPTNITFVGAGLERMAVANLGRWHLAIADVGVAGLPLRYPEVA
jgi:gluconolactonase